MNIPIMKQSKNNDKVERYSDSNSSDDNISNYKIISIF